MELYFATNQGHEAPTGLYHIGMEAVPFLALPV
jgi:hypothetical protein